MKKQKSKTPVSKEYSTVPGMLNGIGLDNRFIAEVQKGIAERSLATFLLAERCKKDLSEAQMAQKLKWTVERIQKVERTKNDDLKIGDLFSYAQAVGRQISLRIK